jgi:PAS domain S-box-containing protein
MDHDQRLVADASVVAQILAQLITVWFCVKISRLLFGTRHWLLIWGIYVISVVGQLGSRMITFLILLGAPDPFLSFLLHAVTPLIASVGQLAAIALLYQWLMRMQQIPKIAFMLPDPAHISIDANSVVIDWDAQAEYLFGWTSAEVIGKPLTELIISDHLKQAHIDGITRFLLRGPGALPRSSYNIEAQNKQGEVFDIKLILSATWDADSVILHAAIWRLRL